MAETMNVKLNPDAELILAALAKKKVLPTEDGITDSNVILKYDSEAGKLIMTVDLNSMSYRGKKINFSKVKVLRDAKTGEIVRDKDGNPKEGGGNAMLAALYGPLSKVLGQKVRLGILGGSLHDVTVTLSMTIKD